MRGGSSMWRRSPPPKCAIDCAGWVALAPVSSLSAHARPKFDREMWSACPNGGKPASIGGGYPHLFRARHVMPTLKEGGVVG
jgi:hypothetical protein